MPLFAVKTTASHEQTSADLISNSPIDGIYAALVNENMTSYIVVEAEDVHAIDLAIEEVPHARKVLRDEISMSEIEQFLTPTSDVEGIETDAIVELIGGPFQGDKAKVIEVAESSERVTVELYEATIPIPVEVRGDQIRVLDKQESE